MNNVDVKKLKALQRCLTLSESTVPVVQEEPEAPSEPFGKYAFDPYRDDVRPEDKEAMSSVEKEAYGAIHTYVTGNVKEPLDRSADLLLSLVKKGLYKPILDPGTGKAYRILLLPDVEDLQRLAAIPVEKTEKGYGVFGPGVLSPTSTRISGWTTSKILAYDFSPLDALGNKIKGYVFAVIEASIQGNAFFGKPGELAAITDEDYEVEQEVIAVGPVKYDKASFVDLRKFPSEDAARQGAIDILHRNSLTEEPESEDEVFGKYAFDRTRMKLKGDLAVKTPELETPPEVAASKALKTYFIKNDKFDLEDKAALLLKLAKEGKYKPVLDPSKQKKAYRILVFNKNTVSGFLSQYGFDINDLENGQTVTIRRGGRLSPTGGYRISGWTTSASSDNLDNISGLTNSVAGGAVIGFVADISSNNFFGRPGKMATAVGATAMEYEKEVIGVGDIKFSAMVIHKLANEKQMPALKAVVDVLATM